MYQLCTEHEHNVPLYVHSLSCFIQNSPYFEVQSVSYSKYTSSSMETKFSPPLSRMDSRLEPLSGEQRSCRLQGFVLALTSQDISSCKISHIIDMSPIGILPEHGLSHMFS